MFFRLLGGLVSFVKKHDVAKRWTSGDVEFRHEHSKFLDEKSEKTTSTLYNRCSERLMLLALKKRYAGQLKVEHTLSQPKLEKQGGLGGFFKKAKPTWTGKTGRIDAAKTTTFLEENPIRGKSAEYFICGPAGLIKSVESALSSKGIDEKTIKHLYEPFFTTKKAGSGLGLSTVYGIVNQHKGHITVKTKINSGSTFTVFFPLLEEKKKF